MTMVTEDHQGRTRQENWENMHQYTAVRVEGDFRPLASKLRLSSPALVVLSPIDGG